MQDRGVDFAWRADEAKGGVCNFTCDEVRVLARQTNGLAAFGVDCLDQPVVHLTRQDHFDDVHRVLVCYAFAVHELRFDVELVEQRVDHRPAAMDDDGVHTNLTHQHDVAGKLGHRLIAAHSVTAKLDDDRGTGVALHVGQSLAECFSGCGPIAVHVLRPHASIPAMIARRVGMPMPFSELVRISSG